jgi:hypothetical protein
MFNLIEAEPGEQVVSILRCAEQLLDPKFFARVSSLETAEFKRTRFDPSQRRDVVRRLSNDERLIDVSESTGIHYNTVRNWRDTEIRGLRVRHDIKSAANR